MPFVYDASLATAGDTTTAGGASTETETFFIKAGSGRNVCLQGALPAGARRPA
jgi:hypothetical protein